MLGIKITDIIYSPIEYYCRMDLLETDLLFKKELVKKERLKLLKENVDFLINLNRMLDDKDMYLWINLAEDNDLFISIKNEKVFNKLINRVENDLRKFGSGEDFLNKVLKFFHKLHWIKIENLKTLSFQIEQSIEKDPEKRQLLLDYLSQYKNISRIEKTYILN